MICPTGYARFGRGNTPHTRAARHRLVAVVDLCLGGAIHRTLGFALITAADQIHGLLDLPIGRFHDARLAALVDQLLHELRHCLGPVAAVQRHGSDRHIDAAHGFPSAA